MDPLLIGLAILGGLVILYCLTFLLNLLNSLWRRLRNGGSDSEDDEPRKRPNRRSSPTTAVLSITSPLHRIASQNLDDAAAVREARAAVIELVGILESRAAQLTTAQLREIVNLSDWSRKRLECGYVQREVVDLSADHGGSREIVTEWEEREVEVEKVVDVSPARALAWRELSARGE